MLTKDDIDQIDNILSKRLKDELNPIKEDVAVIRKEIKKVVSFFDNEYLQLRKRIERLEEHLRLPPIS